MTNSNVDADGYTVSALKVMQSAAGYYLGRSCTAPDTPYFNEPYSRESGYFRTKEAAEKELAIWARYEEDEAF